MTTCTTIARAAGLALVLGLAAGGTSGCSSSGADSSAARDAMPAVGSGPAPASEWAFDEEPIGPEVSVQPQIIVSGSMRLSVDDPKSALDEATAIAAEHGGQASTTDLVDHGDRIRATATLRIPSDSYEEAVEQISGLGVVVEQTTTNEDAGAQIADIDARIAALTTSIDRLSGLMSDAQTTADLIEAERELTSRQSELDALNAQRAWYADRVAYSTLDVTLSSAASADVASPSSWQRSWRAFVEGLGLIAYMLIMLAPWMLVLVPLALLAGWLWRRRRRRGTSGGPGAVPPPPSAASPMAAPPTSPSADTLRDDEPPADGRGGHGHE
ncbi:DUF4349 domain-containing protein [Actinomyces sp. B33]|uniref:DUF4349 domain-containing protein n=1 Tax=Actinomyces sp. B33 TaxID=2942131 RepID=UPI00233FA1D7|nr:DUF4349 domain-containing protein [Actinomyces sp. B33]MDC4233150.1 DUF4349 domain-containing protein [Actinomyces sp. B33]